MRRVLGLILFWIAIGMLLMMLIGSTIVGIILVAAFLWMFIENIRIQSEQKKLLEMKNRFLKERVQFQEEMKILNQKVTAARQRLRQDELFFEKRWRY